MCLFSDGLEDFGFAFFAKYLLFQTGLNLLTIANDSPSLVFNES